MKNFLILASTLILGGLAFGNSSVKINESRSVNGANNGQPVTFTATKNFKSSIRTIAGVANMSFTGIYAPDAKDANVRALKDFQVRFIDASNVKWFSYGNSLISSFIKNGHWGRAFYDKKGRWNYSLLFYDENRLPRGIRAAVKSIYFDMSITLVEEVQTTDGMVYFVHLEDKLNIKILKVGTDGEMETTMDLVKE